MNTFPAATVGRLGRTLNALVRPLFAELGPWSLVDFPEHYNCGDSAIWTGEIALARQLGHAVHSISSRFTYRADAIPAEGVLVIQGGGNFGGLYPTHHDLRLRLLADFPRRPVVQMPQSVEFANPAFRDELQRAIERHGNFTLLVRDQRSYERARAAFECEVLLVPDAAFALGPQRRPVPRAATAVQERTDLEAERNHNLGRHVSEHTFDWLEPQGREVRVAAREMTRAIARLARRSNQPLAHRIYGAAADALARANVRRGFELVTQAELLVTDRLHGHVMASLAGVPHIVVNDRFGKVEALWSTWTRGLPGARFAQTWDEAIALLHEMRTDSALGSPG